MTDDQIKAVRLIVSGKVRALLARHGITDAQQQLASLMTVMGASHSQVYRKLSGRSSWLEEDLMRIASRHGETLGTLFRDDADPLAAPCAAAPDDTVWHAARVNVDNRLVPCEVALGPVPDTPAGIMVLHDTPDGPMAGWADGVAGATVRGAVRALRLDPAPPAHGGYAVFDDDPDVAESIADNLLARGLDAQAFFTTQALRDAPRRFDVYIIDWFSSDTSTAADLVAHLRTHHAPQAAIVVLTGQIQREHTESDLARMIHSHGVMVELKPMRVDLLLAKLQHARQA